MTRIRVAIGSFFALFDTSVLYVIELTLTKIFPFKTSSHKTLWFQNFNFQSRYVLNEKYWRKNEKIRNFVSLNYIRNLVRSLQGRC